jgi:hypothetical protein
MATATIVERKEEFVDIRCSPEEAEALRVILFNFSEGTHRELENHTRGIFEALCDLRLERLKVNPMLWPTVKDPKGTLKFVRHVPGYPPEILPGS